jgi:hypothetical protein
MAVIVVKRACTSDKTTLKRRRSRAFASATIEQHTRHATPRTAIERALHTLPSSLIKQQTSRIRVPIKPPLYSQRPTTLARRQLSILPKHERKRQLCVQRHEHRTPLDTNSSMPHLLIALKRHNSLDKTLVIALYNTPRVPPATSTQHSPNLEKPHQTINNKKHSCNTNPIAH